MERKIPLIKRVEGKHERSYSDPKPEFKATVPAQEKPWSERFNPLKWGEIPPVPNQRIVSREYNAGFFSLLYFQWITPLMTVGYKRSLQENDIWTINPNRTTMIMTEKLQTSFKKRVVRGDRHPLLFALYETFRAEFLIGGICQLFASIIQATSPFVLRYLIKFTQDAFNARQRGSVVPSIYVGLSLVFGITIMQMVQSLQTNHFLYRGMTAGGQARAVLISLIFDKATKISSRAKVMGQISHSQLNSKRNQKPGTKIPKQKGHFINRTSDIDSGWANGKVMNLMSVDSHRIDQASTLFHLIWTSPIACIITLALLTINIGYSATAGFSLLIIGLPGMTLAIKILFSRRQDINKITDRRISLTQEILQAVRFVKLFALENAFLDQHQKIRKKEIRAIQIILGIRNAIYAISLSLPIFASMLAFVTYSLTNHTLEPARVFSSLALFNSLRMPLNLLPLVIGQATDAWSSINRIQDYLLSEEIDSDSRIDLGTEKTIEVKNADFTWESTTIQDIGLSGRNSNSMGGNEEAALQKTPSEHSDFFTKTDDDSTTETNASFKLHNINFSIGHDELVAVIGGVGSGKSSLLAALAGDMRRTKGELRLGATRAYCPQYAWIQNSTIRNNITFGRTWKEDRYNQVIDACALRPDLEILPNGDATEIGERGVTISGGQKQRLNIARAMYYDADLILMDDPLSAVDAHVGRQIMDNAILGLMKNKARILVTHQLWVLSRCDRIIWMEEGQVRAINTFENLMRDDSDFKTLMKRTTTNNDVKKDTKVNIEEKKSETEQKYGPKNTKLMQAEDRPMDSVPWSMYLNYLRASGSIFNAVIAFIFLLGSQGANITTSLWLSWWTSDHLGYTTRVYIGIYAALGSLQALLTFAFSITVTLIGTTASKKISSQAISRVLRAPVSFFDTTPLGRITNRFSRDVDVMDNELSDAIRIYLFMLVMIVSVLGLIIAYFHLFAVALIPFSLLCIFSSGFYRSSAREVKRVESVFRSHVYSKFSEGLSGIACIRAYGLQHHFINELQAAIDNMNSAYFLTFANQRWLSIRLDLLCNLLVFVAGILAITSRFNISPSITGLILSYVLSIVQTIQHTVRQLAEVENGMNATERLHYYGTSLAEETPFYTVKVRKSWPESGDIIFNNVQMRYRENLPLVLSGLTMHVRGGERIGIVGRTGAGKSSIVLALFRLMELSGGCITIDGIDISTISLHSLRSRLAIIPQDPTLFKGTVRSNLDPFFEHTDLELWSALRQSNLVTASDQAEEKKINSVQLDSIVEDEGLNFSLGQRQLMALARALVRGSQIIICDEATSSVDIETDERIQQTIAEAFKGKTLLCIAHRLKTIIGYDRICVLEQGSIVELDTPKKLWDSGGIFWGMCVQNGIREEDFD